MPLELEIVEWRAGRNVWIAWTSRLVTVTLVSGWRSYVHMHVLYCYAPTFATSRESKNKFFDVLQQTLSTMPSR